MGIVLKDLCFIGPAVQRWYAVFDTLKGMHCSKLLFLSSPKHLFAEGVLFGFRQRKASKVLCSLSGLIRTLWEKAIIIH